MDIDSINGGTIDTKGWLNPTVGTLRAKKIICDDIEGGGGGGGGALALNSAVNPGVFTDVISQGSIVGGTAGYNPVSRRISTSDLYAANSSFEFECSGTLLSTVVGTVTDFTSRPVFGIMVGDSVSNILGSTFLEIGMPLYEQPLVWVYKLVATHVASATQGGFALTWSSEVSLSKNNTAVSISAGTMSRIAMGKKDFGVLTPVNDGITFGMFIDNMDFNDNYMTIVKYNHTFRRVA